jgi:hypothetical protein
MRVTNLINGLVVPPLLDFGFQTHLTDFHTTVGPTQSDRACQRIVQEIDNVVRQTRFQNAYRKKLGRPSRTRCSSVPTVPVWGTSPTCWTLGFRSVPCNIVSNISWMRAALVKPGEGRWAKYRLPPVPQSAGTVPAAAAAEGEEAVPLSPASIEIRRYLSQGLAARSRWAASFYPSPAERAHLAEVGKPNFAAEAAGTYARQILGRLLIDLSWNSSRLKGNTYSLADTRRLIEFGEEAEGRDRREAQMVANHKDAIGFLVGAAGRDRF